MVEQDVTQWTYDDISQHLRGLTESERLEVEQATRKSVVAQMGAEPTWEAYRKSSVGLFPPWLIKTAIFLLLLVGGAGAVVSLIRVFTSGRDSYLAQAPTEAVQAVVVGAAFFLLAETMVIIAMLVRRVVFNKNARMQQAMLAFVGMGLLVAVVGNIISVKPVSPALTLEAILRMDFSGVWQWVETLIPPAALLFASLIAEGFTLNELEDRHARRQQFESDLADYRKRVANVDKHEAFRPTLAVKMLDKIRAVNLVGSKAKEKRAIFDALTTRQRYWLLKAELAVRDEVDVMLATFDAEREAAEVAPTDAANFTTPARVAGEQPMLSPAMGFRREYPTKSEEK